MNAPQTLVRFSCPKLTHGLLAALVSVALLLPACRTPLPPADLTREIADLGEWRTTCEGYAVKVARRYGSDAPEYDQAETLYHAAQAAANAYIDAIQTDLALRPGKYATDEYHRRALRAQEASERFVQWAETAPASPGGARRTVALATLIPSLVSSGLKIVEAGREADERTRERIRKELETKKWRSFEDVHRRR